MNNLTTFTAAVKPILKHHDTELTGYDCPIPNEVVEQLTALARELVVAELESIYNAYRNTTGLAKYNAQDPFSTVLRDDIALYRSVDGREAA